MSHAAPTPLPRDCRLSQKANRLKALEEELGNRYAQEQQQAVVQKKRADKMVFFSWDQQEPEGEQDPDTDTDTDDDDLDEEQKQQRQQMGLTSQKYKNIKQNRRSKKKKANAKRVLNKADAVI